MTTLSYRELVDEVLEDLKRQILFTETMKMARDEAAEREIQRQELMKLVLHLTVRINKLHHVANCLENYLNLAGITDHDSRV